MKNLKRKIKSAHSLISSFSSGFTIVELLIYMGILGILLGVITQIFTSSLSTQLASESTNSIEHDERFIIQRLLYDVHRATSIAQPATPGATSSTLQLIINSTTYTYALASGNLQLTDSSGTNNLNGIDTTLSALSFTRLGNASGRDTIRVAFTITSTIKRTGTGVESKTVQTTVGLRPN